MALPSTPADPPTTTATATATAATTRLFTSPPPPTRPPTPPLPQSYHHHHHHHLLHHHTTYPPQPQPQPPLYTAQPLPNLAPRLPANSIHSQLATRPQHDPSQGILYPVASSGRGFLPKAIRPQSADHTVTVANPGGFPPRPVLVAAYPHPHQVRPFGDPHAQSVHLIRPTHLHNTLLGSTGGVMPGMVKGVPVSAQQKIWDHVRGTGGFGPNQVFNGLGRGQGATFCVAASQPSISDCNGYKDLRDRSRDDSIATVSDRKVRICDSSSLYALCRSWLRNGFPEENQPQYVDGVKSLPKPSPALVADCHSPVKKEGDKQDEEFKKQYAGVCFQEECVEHLSPTDLLHRHVKRAKKVRGRLREERLQRIARYKTRLALLLPPLIEQQPFRNDAAAGN
ncbi:unnamed protein product [Camellia sinensis]